MVALTSRNNPKIKLARALRQRKARREHGLFLVEGAFHIGAALEAGAPIEFVAFAAELLGSPFANELVGKLKAQGIETLQTSPDVLESLSDKDNPQGILAVARQSPAALSSLVTHPSSLFLALLAPQDPGNLGSILRTLDAAGAQGLVLLDGGADPWHPQAVRAAMGAHFSKPIVQTSFAEFTAWAQGLGVHVVGSSAHAELDYRQATYPRPSALLLGSEREGLGAQHLAACEQVVALPMRGRVTSLNLAVAAGILIYEILK